MESLDARIAREVWGTPGGHTLQLGERTYRMHLICTVGGGRGRNVIAYNNPDGSFYQCQTEYDRDTKGLLHLVGYKRFTASEFRQAAQRQAVEAPSVSPTAKAVVKVSNLEVVKAAVKSVQIEGGSDTFHITRNELAYITGLSVHTVDKWLNVLVEQGDIKKTGQLGGLLIQVLVEL